MGRTIWASQDGRTSALIGALGEARERTLQLVDALSTEQLESVHSPLMSPLVWDLGHIAAFEDLWLVHRYGDRPLLREDLMDVYDAFETPRAGRGSLPMLRHTEALDYLAEVRRRTTEVAEQRGVGDGTLFELVVRHEHQHTETMLQTMQLAGLPAGLATPGKPARATGIGSDGTGSGPGPSNAAAPKAAVPGGAPLTGLEFVDVPGGPCTIGAGRRGFAYDNERPQHRTDVRAYRIARVPVTNATYLTFVEGGGYERREWWSDEGWAWKEEYDITRPGAWTQELDGEWRLGVLHPLDPHRPVIHVSWFEAAAFAKAHGARLPTELEWEKAATWDLDAEEARPAPWGKAELQPGVHANVDQIQDGPEPVGGLAEGASPCGCLAMIGDVWEWTSSVFEGYPGFRAHPYREYSEVFFGDAFRVLRGGSWATRARVVSPTFRNWDYPQRRQIFSGIRLAQNP